MNWRDLRGFLPESISLWSPQIRGSPTFQHLFQFNSHSFSADLQFKSFHNRRITHISLRLGINREVKPTRKPDQPQHAQGVIHEGRLWIERGFDELGLQIFQTASEIFNL